MPGTYSVEVAYTGYPTTITNDVVVAAGDTLRLDLTLDNSGGILLDEVVIIDYKEPIYEKDHTISGSIHHLRGNKEPTHPQYQWPCRYHRRN